MKNIKLIIITLFVFLFCMVNVDAMTLEPTGTTSGKRGSEITLYITLNRMSSEKMISAVDGKFSYDGNVLTMVRAESLMGGSWSELSSVGNNGIFSYANLSFSDLINTTSKNIVKIVFKINENASYGNTIITINNPSATDEEGNGVSITGNNHIVKVLSDVNSLKKLTVSSGVLNFNEDIFNYNLEVNSDKVTIGAEKKDNTSTLSGDIGEKILKYGLNTFKINVTSESGIKKTYTLNITRPDNRNKINTLSKLVVSEGKIKFNKDTLIYNLTVEKNITKINVDCELTDSKSSFVSGYGSRTVSLKDGKNVIEIKVKAENESIRVYTINVTKKSDKSNNNYLSELKLNYGNINFDKETLEYKVSVDSSVENIEIELKTENNKAKYEIVGNNNLKVGENIITIKVIAEDKSERIYKIIVTKKNEIEKLSNNSKLSDLIIKGYDINFNSEIYNYDLVIKDEDSLTINYVQEELTSNVSVKGNSNLKDGSVIEILVLAEDGSETVYSINIIKDGKSNILLSIIIGMIFLIIIIVAILLLKKKINNKKDIDNNFINNEKQINNNIQSVNSSFEYNMSQNNNSNNFYNSQNMNYNVINNQQNINNQNNNGNM